MEDKDREIRNINEWAAMENPPMTDEQFEAFVTEWREVHGNRSMTTSDIVIASPQFLYTYPRARRFNTDEFQEFLSIPKKEIPILAAEFIAAIETQETLKWCACTWKIHPDDIDKERQRKVRIDANEWCVLHTKVGLILGFFAFVFGGEDANTPIRVEPKDD